MIFPRAPRTPTVRDLFVSFLDEEQVELFAAWAFGESYEQINEGINFLKAWNDLHSDLLILKPEGVMVEDAEKMVKLWKENS